MSVGQDKEELLNASEIDNLLEQVAEELIRRTSAPPALVSIRRGGDGVMNRIARRMEALRSRPIATGSVDIALYRDDAATVLASPKRGPAHISFDIGGKDIILVDDVLHTGRTVRAAIDCLLDYGRPKRVWLAVLCDRGGRELPIAADVVAYRCWQLEPNQRLHVRVSPTRPSQFASTPPDAPGTRPQIDAESDANEPDANEPTADEFGTSQLDSAEPDSVWVASASKPSDRAPTNEGNAT